MDGPPLVRMLFVVLSGLVIVFLVLKTIPVIRDMTWGQRLFLIASMCMLLYAADASREAVLQDIGWRWRMIPFALGIAFYGAYILEPLSAQRKYFTGRSWFHKDEDPS